MKIAIVRQRYNPYGGAERFVERALAALAAEGIDVFLIARQWTQAAANGFQRINCDPPSGGVFGGRLARDRGFALAAAKLMAAGQFDLVQSHERIPGCSIFRAGDGVHAAWLAQRARVLGAVGRWSQRLSPYHRYVLDAEANMFAHPALRAVICNSRMVADEIHRFYGVDRERLVLIENGVDLDVFNPAQVSIHRAGIRRASGIPESVPLLLHVGSGFARKGVPQLLQAMARCAGGEFHLAIVGADRKLNALRATAERLGIGRRVHFTGPLPDVRPWYGAADGFILPTLYDPGPNAVLEAMACGLPVLTSTSCGARDWVIPGKNGYLVDALDVDALSDGLLRLCALAELPASRLLARAAVAELGLPAMADRLIALYRRLIVGNGLLVSPDRVV